MSDNVQQTRYIFLGAGGPEPSIRRYDPITGQIHMLVSFPEGHSVYAIALDSDSNSLAVGTKAGAIHWYPDIDFDQQSRSEPLVQGSPVLSACLIDPTRLVVSDADGRCCVWDLSEPTTPEVLLSGGAAIFSLYKLADRFVGLSSTGELLFWRISDCQLIETIQVPPPPRMGGLVSLFHWSASDRLAWPVQGGRLALYQLQDGHICTRPAHDGDFYAMTFLGDALITAGLHDGRIKLWQAGSDNPVSDWPFPHGVFSLAALNGDGRNILLVDGNGAAGVYAFDSGRPDLKCRLPGTNFRLIVGPDAQDLKTADIHRRETAAEQIGVQIQNKIAHNELEDIEELFSRLVDLGYEHLALGLRAELARHHKDFAGELKIYRNLAQILPDEIGSVPSLERFATILTTVWQLQEASTICDRILAIDPKHPASKWRKTLYKYIRILKGDDHLIESDVPLQLLVEAANISGKGFCGRVLIRALDPQLCRGVRLDSHIVAAQYERVRAEQPKACLPPAKPLSVWWLSGMGPEQVQVVLFGTGIDIGVEGLKFGLKLTDAGGQSLVMPMAVFEVKGISQGEPFKTHNAQTLSALSKLGDKAVVNEYFRKVHGAATKAIRQLMTAAQAKPGVF